MNILQKPCVPRCQTNTLPIPSLGQLVKPVCILSLLTCSFFTQEIHAQTSSNFFGQYATQDGQTTMTVDSGARGMKISGRGQFSMYHGRCKITSTYTAVCAGEGTRFKDRQQYSGSYELRLSRNGERLTSRWTVTYDTGEYHSGVSHMSKIN